MARDIKMQFNTTYFDGDLVLGNSDLERDEGLSTAVLMSLNTDRRADESDNYDNNDRRGWWGDLISEIEDDQIGSKLYLLRRSTNIQEIEIKAKQYAYESLEWLIDDGIAESIEVDTEVFGQVGNYRLALKIKIYKKNDNIETYQFDDLWNNTPVIGGE